MKIFNSLIFTIILLFSCSNTESNVNNNSTSVDSLTNKEILNLENDENVIETYMDIPMHYLLGQITPESDTLFVAVPRNKTRLRQEYIHRDVLEPFLEMHAAAAKEGINLDIISVTRPFREQQIIWETRWNRNINPEDAAKEVLKYIAMPGTSRHHWGTDIDVIGTKLYIYETDWGKKAYKWMIDNANDFGFYQVYTADRETGYNEEKWHWTYFPVSKQYQIQYREKINYSNIVGFPGWETAEKLNVIDNYVFGINPILLNY